MISMFLLVFWQLFNVFQHLCTDDGRELGPLWVYDTDECVWTQCIDGPSCPWSCGSMNYICLCDEDISQLKWNSNCLSFPGTCIHSRYLVGFVLLDVFLSAKYFVIHCLSFCSLSYGYCIVFPYDFWLHLWYLHTFPVSSMSTYGEMYSMQPN